MKTRCSWVGTDPLMIKYHDEEWGTPLHDDRKLFEYLLLDSFQAGLSWAIILKKRPGFRQAFSDFDPAKIARYDERDIERLLTNAGIIRNRQKITAAITNAQKFLELQKQFGSFDAFIWGFTGGKPLLKRPAVDSDIPAKTDLSDQVSQDLKKRGFKFVGSTIIYAFLQGAGIVNDHVSSCFRASEL